MGKHVAETTVKLLIHNGIPMWTSGASSLGKSSKSAA